MLIGGKFSRSWALLKESWNVLRNYPSLAIFPIISGIAVLLASVPFVIAMAVTGIFHGSKHDVQLDTLHYVIVGAMYLVNYFIIIFFNSALVSCAYEALNGGTPTVGSGIQAASARIPQILGYSLIAATVGVILKAIQDRAGIVGTIVAGFIGLAWNLAVFLVVPILVLEKQSPIAAVKESAGLLRRSFGEQIIGNVGIGLASGLLAVLAVIPLCASVFFFVNGAIYLGVSMLGLMLLYILVLSVAISSLNVIYQTGLYIYCRTGQVPGAFTPEHMQYAFVPKPQRGKFLGR